MLGSTWREAFYLIETNRTGGDESGTAVANPAMRIFRNRPEYRFEGRIHEQKSRLMPTYLPERFETTAIAMEHCGYLASRVAGKDKSRRNIELLAARGGRVAEPVRLVQPRLRVPDAERLAARVRALRRGLA